ncbi:alkaline phosphatase family protein [Granulicoccus sp. GXG6511]|uniref:alkaline phosphatase family protein n=1 Tax=Granulicoccus sp. GXG6511 TaxID=3381351 RepID=UPI003D7D74AC
MFPQSMVLPAYGAGSVADVLPSVGARLGMPGADDLLGLPDGDRWVVLLIDGLGEDLLAGAAEDAPFLSGLRADNGRVITAGAPSTTVTSITSLGTGLPPGGHGMAGYSFRIHGPSPARGGRDQILNALLWDSTTTAAELQPVPTWFEHAEAAGITASTVTPARFQGTGLTESALRGARFVGIRDESDGEGWLRSVVTAATASDRTLVYAYERALDHIGHGAGVSSKDWLDVLRVIDQRAARLRAELPDDVQLLITADHGMLDVPGRNFVLIEHEPALMAGLRSFAGEGRLRHFYTDEPDALAVRWADRMGDHAWVRTRDDAFDEGWFGSSDDRVRDRFGDVIVAMRTDWAVMSTSLPRELDIIGMHGSLTPVEMNVPLLLAH